MNARRRSVAVLALVLAAPAAYAGLPGSPDLTIEKSHSGDLVRGGTAAYTLRVTNAGAVATTAGQAVSVVESVPAGLTATSLGGTGWSCNLISVSCARLDPLAAGASYPVITFTATVAADAPAQITNSATVSGGGDATAATDSDTATVGPVIPAAPLPVPARAGWATLLLAALLLIAARRAVARAR